MRKAPEHIIEERKNLLGKIKHAHIAKRGMQLAGWQVTLLRNWFADQERLVGLLTEENRALKLHLGADIAEAAIKQHMNRHGKDKA